MSPKKTSSASVQAFFCGFVSKQALGEVCKLKVDLRDSVNMRLAREAVFGGLFGPGGHCGSARTIR